MKLTDKKVKDLLSVLFIALLALLLLFFSYKIFLTGESDLGLSEEETRLCSLLKSMDGVGRVTVNVNAEGEEKLVVVVCDGAESYLVRADILRVVANATGAKTENIVVYKMASDK